MRKMPRQTRVMPVGQAQKASAVTASLPAPVGGWNARDAISEMDPTDAVTLINWLPLTTKVMIRFGHTQYATGLPDQVESIFAYQSGTTNKLIAVSNGAFYDVTSGGAAPAPSVSGLTNSRWQYVNITNTGGSYVICCNGADAVRAFDGSSWSSPSISGVTSSNLININLFKNRLWFCEVGTLKAWYLGTQAIQGTAAALDLSAFAPHGGYLMAMGTWTIDAGYGVDDLAVFVTSNGDVIVYRGTDPTSASTWALVGVWWLGSPVGRRCFVKYKGDLLLITRDGLLPLSGALQSSRLNPRVALTDKIQQAISTATSNYGANFGWCVLPYPQQNFLILNVPVTEGDSQEQYVMNMITGSWGQFQGWNANCWELLGDNIYFGGDTFVGKAWNTNADNGNDISSSALQAFNYFGTRGRQKRFSMFRPTFQTNGTPTVHGNMNVDFDESTPSPVLSSTQLVGGVWDSAVFDTDVFAGDFFSRSWNGTTGVGYCAAPAITTSTNGVQMQWIATDVIMQPGGYL